MVASISKRNRIWRPTFRYGGRRADGHSRLEPEDGDAPLIEHPIPQPYSKAGRLSLYGDPTHTVDIIGVEEEVALDLLDEIYAWCGWQPRTALPSLMGG